MTSLDRDDARVIIALDYPSAKQAQQLVTQLDAKFCKLKIGKELFTREGPELVRYFVAQGFDVFLDLKFHDIPNTVAKACQAAAELGVWMMNVHASGGRKMMQAARETLTELPSPPLLIGVTVLTSMDEEDLQEVGVKVSPQSQVLRLATLAKQAGLDGVVCSGREASALRAELGQAFTLVTPGCARQVHPWMISREY